jgi:acyl carrier protein
MTNDQIQETVLRILREIAPEADPALIEPDVDVREQLDIDSMDFLNFVIGVHHELQVEIPEADYPQLVTLDGLVRYLGARLPVAQA